MQVVLRLFAQPLFGNLADINHGHHGFLKALHRAELVRTVEVETACKDIGAGKTHEGELCSVCSSSNGSHLWCHACFGYGFFGNVYNVHHRLNLLSHVVVLVIHVERDDVAILLVEFLHHLKHLVLSTLEVFAVVVAYDERELCLLTTATDAGEVEEAFIAFSGFWNLVGWKHVHEFGSNAASIQHLVFGIAGMDGTPVDSDFG